MTFAVTACGHSGTMFLAQQLGRARGWTVLHEPDESVSFRAANQRFEGKLRYGEVNSYLLSGFSRLNVPHKAVILRNPYDICQSVARSGGGEQALWYVRESISTLDCLAASGIPVILFRKMVSDPEYLIGIARMLGVELTEVDVTAKVNEHRGTLHLPLIFNKIVRSEFDAFLQRYEA